MRSGCDDKGELRYVEDANDGNPACAPAKPYVSPPLRRDAAAETSSPVTLNAVALVLPTATSCSFALHAFPFWYSKQTALLALRGRARDQLPTVQLFCDGAHVPEIARRIRPA